MFYLIRTQYLEDYGTRHKFKGGSQYAVECNDIGDALAMVHTHLFQKNLEWVTSAKDGAKHAPTIEFPITPRCLVERDEYEFQNLESLVKYCDEWETVYHLKDGKVQEHIESRIKHDWQS